MTQHEKDRIKSLCDNILDVETSISNSSRQITLYQNQRCIDRKRCKEYMKSLVDALKDVDEETKSKFLMTYDINLL